MTKEQALALFQQNDLVSLGLRADAVRKQLHPGLIVGYALDNETQTSSVDGLAVLHLARDGSIEQHLSQMAELRQQQEKTSRFISFTISVKEYPEITAAEYLKLLAISRIYFDTVPHIEISVAALDSKLAQVALRFGADDLGRVSLSASEGSKQPTEEQVRRLIYDAGFFPKQRARDFQTYYVR